MTRRSALPVPDPRSDWQKAQGAICGCRGTDDMCVCQNVNPWPRASMDWRARAITAEAALTKISLSVGQMSAGQMALYARAIINARSLDGAQ